MMETVESPPPNKALQRTAAPLGSRAVRENWLATVAAARAFPAAVAELGSFGVVVGTQMKATIQYIVQTRLPDGQTFTAANLDVPWMDLARHDAGLPRPSESPAQLRVRITRPDGAVTETFARLSGISVAAKGEPPGRLVFDELSPEDAPVGSQVMLLG